MIDPRELRIGNIVCECPFVENPVWHHKVEGILKGNWNEKKDRFTNDVWLDNGDIWGAEELYPIPLSEEWLLRGGFEECASPYRDQKAWVIGKDADRLIWCANELYKPASYDTFIKITAANYLKDQPLCEYLHSLQNLIFALTGEELVFKEI